jgi:hypothetical protein
MFELCLLEQISIHAVEADHRLAVCVGDLWVARIFSKISYKRHRCVCVYTSNRDEEFVAVVNVFPGCAHHKPVVWRLTTDLRCVWKIFEWLRYSQRLLTDITGVCVFIHLTEVRNLLLCLTCFLDVHTTSQSCGGWPQTCGVFGRSLSCCDMLKDFLHTSQVCVCVCLYT